MKLNFSIFFSVSYVSVGKTSEVKAFNISSETCTVTNRMESWS